MERSELCLEVSSKLILECWCVLPCRDYVNPVWEFWCGHLSDNIYWVCMCDHLQWVYGCALLGHVNVLEP